MKATFVVVVYTNVKSDRKSFRNVANGGADSDGFADGGCSRGVMAAEHVSLTSSSMRSTKGQYVSVPSCVQR